MKTLEKPELDESMNGVLELFGKDLGMTLDEAEQINRFLAGFIGRIAMDPKPSDEELKDDATLFVEFVGNLIALSLKYKGENVELHQLFEKISERV